LIAGWQVAQQGQANLGFLGEFKMNPANSGVSVVQANGVRWLRPYGLLPHPNILAGHLAIGLLCAVTWIVASSQRTRWIGIGIFMFGLWILLLTFSRSAWGAFAGGAFALLPLIWSHLRLRERRWTFATAALLVIVLGMAFFILYRPFLAARTGEGNESIEQRSISDRAIYSDYAFRAIGESPLLGVGIGNFPWRASYYLSFTDFDLRGQPVHQIFLSVWSELGLVGFALALLTLILGVEAALRAIRQGSSATSPETVSDSVRRAVLLCAIIVLMLIGLLDHYPWTLLHFQAAWWGLLAAAASPANKSAAPQMESGVS
jgi:O-antigen ligase